MSDLPRAFVKIQKLRRIAIPNRLMEMLGWEISDPMIIEAFNGKLIVTPVKGSLKPRSERYR